MRILLLSLIVAFSVEAMAARCELSSARLGQDVIKIGDSERRVLEHRPDRTVQLENREGGAAGIRYDFYLRNKTIQIYVRGGRVDRICHLDE